MTSTQLSAMRFFVARYTERSPIGLNESQCWIFSERFNVMSVQFSCLSTILTSVSISYENLCAPLLQFIGQPSTLSKHRLSVLVSIPSSPFPCTRLRTKDLFAAHELRKFLIAYRARFCSWRISLRPTRARTPLRLTRAITERFIGFPTYGTDLIDPGILHVKSIAHYCEMSMIEEKYCEIAARRLGQEVLDL